MEPLSRRRVVLTYLFAIATNVALSLVAILLLISQRAELGILAGVASVVVVVLFIRWTRRHMVTWPLPPRQSRGD